MILYHNSIWIQPKQFTEQSFSHHKPTKKEKKKRKFKKIEENQETATGLWLLRPQNLVGLGWKFLLLRRWWLEGLINCIRNAFTAPTFDSKDGSKTRFFWGFGSDIRAGLLELRCRLHRNEPGCDVGEQRHDARRDEDSRFLEAIDLQCVCLCVFFYGFWDSEKRAIWNW